MPLRLSSALRQSGRHQGVNWCCKTSGGGTECYKAVSALPVSCHMVHVVGKGKPSSEEWRPMHFGDELSDAYSKWTADLQNRLKLNTGVALNCSLLSASDHESTQFWQVAEMYLFAVVTLTDESDTCSLPKLTACHCHSVCKYLGMRMLATLLMSNI